MAKKSPELPDPTHWLTCSVDQTKRHGDLAISVILDGGAHMDFSGIRIIFLHEESETFRPFCIETSPDGGLPGWKLLRHDRDARLPNNSVSRALGGTHLSSNPKPLCTVAFTLSDEGAWPWQFASINLRKEPLPAGTRLRVVYDRIHPCTADQHSVLAYFASSHYTTPFSARRRPALSQIKPTLVVRILPIDHDRRPPFPALPHHLLRHIITDVLGDDPRWRAQLLMYGLVCKSWSKMLDIFFERIGDGTDKASIHSVARSLQTKPERGRLIRRFAPFHFRNQWAHAHGDSAQEGVVYKALTTILKTTGSVRNIILTDVGSPFSNEFVEALTELREVRSCRVSGCDIYNRDNLIPHIGIIDIQRFVAKWANLEQLTIIFWGDDDGTSELFSELETPQYQVARLRLEFGHLTGDRLCWFASSPRSCLREVSLFAVQGLSNRDLHQFLTQISPTIVSLTIRKCFIFRPEDQEYAFEAVLPNMPQLETATLYGDLVSTLAITRKQSRPLESLTRPRTRIKIWGFPLHGELIEALKVCWWDSVIIKVMQGQLWDQKLPEDAMLVAWRRGVELIIHGPDEHQWFFDEW